MNNEDAISRAWLLNNPMLHTWKKKDLVEAIKSAPSVPPQVVQGRWVWNPDHCKWACSVCGGMEGECESPICKWCGAKMDGGKDDAAR